MSQETKVSSTTEASSTQVKVSNSSTMSVESKKVVETVTTTTVKTTSTSKVVESNSLSNNVEVIDVDAEPEKKSKDTIQENGETTDNNAPIKTLKLGSIGNLSGDNKSTIMNVQSVCPNAKPTILKVQDDGTKQTLLKMADDGSQKNTPTRTVLIVNRDGNKVTLAVSKQPITTTPKSEGSDSVVTQQTSTNNTSLVSSLGKTCI